MLTIGIIGSGFGRYGLLPAFGMIRGCKPVAISALDEKKLDAVAIAVPPDAQYNIAKEAIDKGLHVFAEKPLAPTYKQAQELLDRATKQHVVHAVDFLFPEIDVWKKAKKIVDSGQLGRITQVSVDWDFMSYDLLHKKISWKTDVARGGGALSFYFSHALYYLEYFAGKISEIHSSLIYAKERGNGAETGVDLIFTLTSGAAGRAHINCSAAGRHEHRFTIQCEQGALILENEHSIVSNFVLTCNLMHKRKQVFVSKKLNTRDDERVQVVKRIASKFVLACKNNTQMTPSFAHGVRVAELVELIRKNQL